MKSFSLPYGTKYLTLELPEDQLVTEVTPSNIEAAEHPLASVQFALDHPIDHCGLDSFSGARCAAIAINDKTRPVPNEFLLPPLLGRLERLRIPREKISLIIATGTHKPMQPAEFRRILPDSIVDEYPIVSHDCDNFDELVYLGETNRGTKVLVNKLYHESDLKIVVGNIEPHHFMGFSGGAKSASIGLTGRGTINQNHAMLVDPGARIAEYEHNPMRQDVEEIGRIIGVHYAVNAVLNHQKRIVRVFAGHPLAVIKNGIPLSMELCQTKVEGKFDLVIASVGGHPKDINLYQSQKALTHAALITRPGGVIILLAACPEGSGNQAFENFMTGMSSLDEVEQKFVEIGFQVGPHKAYQLARQLANMKVIIVSEMDHELMRKLFLIPALSVNQALMTALDFLPERPRIAVLPHATNTVSIVE